MKIMFSGSRYSSPKALKKARELAQKYIPQAKMVLVGDAPGVDEVIIKTAEELGQAHKLVVKAPGWKPRVHIPKEAKVVVNAGKGYSFREKAYSRDRDSVRKADIVIVIRTNKSKGSTAVAEYAKKLGKKVEIWDF